MLPTHQQWMAARYKRGKWADALLGKIDKALDEYHKAGAGSRLRKMYLGDIFCYTSWWLGRYPKSSRGEAVRSLHDLADEETNDLSIGEYNELRTLAAVGSLPRQTVRVVMMCTQNVNRHAIFDLRRADRIWSQAGLGIRTEPANSDPEEYNVNLNGNELGFAGETELVQIMTQAGYYYRGFIHCCYAPQLPAGAGGAAAGKTERPTDPAHVGFLHDAFVKIGANICRSETLAHQLGHALLDEGAHHYDRRNLMADGTVRKGTELTPGQIVIARGSRYAG